MIRRGLCSQILSRNMFHFKNSLTLGGAGAKPVTSGQLLLNRGSLNEELLWIRRWGWLVGIFFILILRGGGTWKKHQVRDVVAYFIPALWSSLFLRDGRGITKKPFLGNFTSWFGLLTNFFVYTSLQTQLNLFASLCMFATKLPGTTCLSPDIFPHMPYFYRLIFPAKYWPDTDGVHMK